MRFTQALPALRIQIERPQDPGQWGAVLRIAPQHQLTIYDAAYLELALRKGLPLATLDGDLRKAAAAIDVRLLEK